MKRITPGEVYCGDCREILPGITTESVRLIHTSPPYNIGRNYNAYEDSKPRREYLDFIREVLAECYRVLMPGGSLFWQTGYTADTESVEFIFPVDQLTFEVFLSQGFRLKDRIIWRYFGSMAFKKKYTNRHETILWWVKPGAPVLFDVFPVRERSREYDARNNLFGRNPGNVWEVDRVAYGSTEQTSHIAVFPEEISDRIVLSASREGELCLDPFSGSGTLCKVAKSRGRQFIGIEIGRDYVRESGVRLGYCQANEFDHVLSELIKEVGFGRQPKAADVGQVAERLASHLLGPPAPGIWTKLKKSEVETISALEENSIPKPRKVEIWRLLDCYFESSVPIDPVTIVDRAYRSFFRLHAVHNGVMRLALALRWIGGFRPLSAEDLKGHIHDLARAEPSSYQVKGKHITLVSANRSVRKPLPSVRDREKENARAPEFSFDHT